MPLCGWLTTFNPYLLTAAFPGRFKRSRVWAIFTLQNRHGGYPFAFRLSGFLQFWKSARKEGAPSRPDVLLDCTHIARSVGLCQVVKGRARPKVGRFPFVTLFHVEHSCICNYLQP